MEKEKIRAFFAGKQRKITAAVVSTLLALTLLGMVGARYMFRENTRHYIIAKEFYFTSSLLDGDTHTLTPGSTQVTFTLGNHPDDLRYSQTPIEYTVTVDGSVPQGTNLSGTLGAGSIQDQAVTITGLTPGEHTVTAVGKQGYHKTLTAKLIVPEAERLLYKYLDASNPEYVLLTVWSKGCTGAVTIAPPSGLIPDNTDPVMADAITGQSIVDAVSFAGSGYASHVYRFFGSAQAGQFTVTCGDVAAEEKAPNA